MAKGLEIDFQETHEKRKRRRRFFFWFLIVICIGVVVFGTWWLVFRSPLFQVQRVNVSGIREVSEDSIVNLLKTKALNTSFIKRLLGVRNMFAWPEALADEDFRMLAAIRTVAIQKNYQERTISITVTEREPFGVWCDVRSGAEPAQNETECFWFDRDGALFKEAFGVQGNLISAVNDYSGRSVGIGGKILPDRFILNIFSIFEVLRRSDLSTKEIRLDDLSNEAIEVRTSDGLVLRFSLRFPADGSLAVIESLRAKPDFKNLQYIDFTVENRAYYK